jgi:hypothetical protein
VQNAAGTEHADRFLEDASRIARVLENVRRVHDIEAAIGKRKIFAGGGGDASRIDAVRRQ